MKHISPEVWQSIYRVVRDARLDGSRDIRERLVRLAERNGFTEQQFIEAQILEALPDALRPKQEKLPGERAALRDHRK